MLEIATCAEQTCLQIFANDRVRSPGRGSCHDTEQIRILVALGNGRHWHRCDASCNTSVRSREGQDQDCPWRPSTEHLLSLARNARRAEALGSGGERRRRVHWSELATINSAFGCGTAVTLP